MPASDWHIMSAEMTDEQQGLSLGPKHGNWSCG